MVGTNLKYSKNEIRRAGESLKKNELPSKNPELYSSSMDVLSKEVQK